MQMSEGSVQVLQQHVGSLYAGICPPQLLGPCGWMQRHLPVPQAAREELGTVKGLDEVVADIMPLCRLSMKTAVAAVQDGTGLLESNCVLAWFNVLVS